MAREKKKIVYVAGVLHDRAFMYEVLDAILSNAVSGQKVGLEVNPKTLAAFEKTRQRQLKERVSFSQGFSPFFQESISRKYKKIGISGEQARTDLYHSKANTREYYQSVSDLEFFYKIYKNAKERGLSIMALDSNIAHFYNDVYELKTLNEKGAKYKQFEELKSYITTPIREKHFIKKIIKEKPDFVVVGEAHRKEIIKQLKKQGIRAKTIYRPKLRDKKANKILKRWVKENKPIRKKYKQRKEKRRKQQIIKRPK